MQDFGAQGMHLTRPGVDLSFAIHTSQQHVSGEGKPRSAEHHSFVLSVLISSALNVTTHMRDVSRACVSCGAPRAVDIIQTS